MHPRPQNQNLLYSLGLLSLAFGVNFLANGCGQQEQPVSPASIGHETHQPYTFYEPSPADGAADVGERVTFEWQFDNPDNIPMHYEIYMGNDSLILIADATPPASYTPSWGKQAQAKEMLVQVYEMQRAYRTYFNSYAANGACASAAAPHAFFWTLGLTIDSEDRFQYAMVSACNTFTCTAYGQLDYSDPYHDTWSIDEDGKIQHTVFDLELEFQPSTEYIWQVVAVDSNQNRIESPIWHFTTTSNMLYPNHRPVTPCVPYPEDNFTDLPLFNCFSWYAGSPADSLTYDIYWGPGENPPLKKSGYHGTIFVPDWLYQQYVVEALNSLLNIEMTLKETGGSFRGNGDNRLAGGRDYFDSSFFWGAMIRHNDIYDYYVFADSNTFSVIAVSTINFDDDSDIDTWTVDQTGLIRCEVNDANTPYRAHQRYSWKIVARDSRGNSIDGPIWHFSTRSFINTPF
jgi:hypothetical protein